MANPYILLIALFGAIGLFASGVSVGYKYEKNANLAALAATQNTAIAAANLAASAEIARTISAAKAEADARVKASAIRSKGELDAMRKSRVACARDMESMGLLHESINVANGQSNTPSIVLDPMRPIATTTGWFGTVGSKLGIQGSGTIRTLPPTP